MKWAVRVECMGGGWGESSIYKIFW